MQYLRVSVNISLRFVKVAGQAGSGPRPAARTTAVCNPQPRNYELVQDLQVHAPTAAAIKAPLASPRNLRSKQAVNFAEVSPSKTWNKPAPVIPDNRAAERLPHPCSPADNQEKGPYINVDISTRMYANFPLQQTVSVSVEPVIFSLPVSENNRRLYQFILIQFQLIIVIIISLTYLRTVLLYAFKYKYNLYCLLIPKYFGILNPKSQ